MWSLWREGLCSCVLVPVWRTKTLHVNALPCVSTNFNLCLQIMSLKLFAMDGVGLSEGSGTAPVPGVPPGFVWVSTIQDETYLPNPDDPKPLTAGHIRGDFCLNGISDQQHDDQFNLVREQVALHDNSHGAQAKWAASLIYDMTNFWNKQFNSAGVQLVANLHSCPAAPNKAPTVETLVQYQCCPISATQIAAVLSTYFSLDAVDRVEIGSQPCPSLTWPTPAHDAGTAVESGADESSASRKRPRGESNADDEFEELVNGGDTRAMLKLMFMQCKSLQAVAAGGADPTKTVETQPAVVYPNYDEKCKARVKSSFKNKTYIDLQHFSKATRMKKQFRNPGDSKVKTFLGKSGLILQTEVDDFEPTRQNSWEAMKSGLNFVIRVLSVEDHTVVPDLIDFFDKVEAYRKSTEDSKCNFVKQFMAKFPIDGKYSDRFNEQHDLVSNVLEREPVRPHSSRTDYPHDDRGGRDRRPRSRRDSDSGRDRTRDRGSKDRRGRGRGSDNRHSNSRADGTRAKKVCFSRAFKKCAPCTYPRCTFSHECMSCGGDHDASTCSNWIPSLVAQKCADAGMKEPK